MRLMPDKPKVVKLAQPGYDVKTAGDENLIYNSNWPLLPIYKQDSFTSSDWNTEHQPVASHDLGYIPAFWWFANTNILTWNGATPALDQRAEFNGPVTFFPGITKDRLVFDINPGVASGTIQFYYYIFALDITKPYTAPITKVGAISGGGGNKVFKLAKPDKDINSKNLEDYVIHSQARSPLVHAVTQQKTAPDGSVGGYGFTFQHNLGYAPMFFAYGKTGGVFGVNNPTSNSYIILPVGGITSGFTVDDKNISYTNLNNNVEISLVVLKDPFIIDYSVRVTI